MKDNQVKHILSIPPADLKISREGSILYVFDILRQKKIILTPEEYVRQNFIVWLINNFNFPPSLMANEVHIKLNSTTKRCDTVVYDKKGLPLMIIEYKAPFISISQQTLDQILRYNIVLGCPYLIVSNGLVHYVFKINEDKTVDYLNEIPNYQEIVDGRNT